MDVRPLSGDEWQLKRELRLAALKDSPAAFASSYAREVHRSESEWRVWPPGGAFFTAFGSDASDVPGSSDVSGTPDGTAGPSGSSAGIAGLSGSSAGMAGFSGFSDGVAGLGSPALGIAGSWVAAADPDTTHLISMWVTPAARGRGVAGLLIDAVIGWARDHGHRNVELEIARGNTAAMSAYLRRGFVVTERDPFTTGGTVLIHTVG